MHKLPRANWTLVRALSQYLIHVVSESKVNKMTVRNVGIVFSPTLNIPAPVFAAFLTDFDAIFGTDPPIEALATTTLEAPVSDPLTPEDIRYPRHQMFSDIPTPSYQQDAFNLPKQGLGLSYDEQNQHPHNAQHRHSQHPNQQTSAAGFIPLQPSYETAYDLPPQQLGESLFPANYNAFARPGAMGQTAQTRDAKARRRESSMLMMGVGGGGGHRNSSLPMLRGFGGMFDPCSAGSGP